MQQRTKKVSKADCLRGRKTYYDCNIQNHIRDITRAPSPRGVNELSQSSTERVGQAHNSRSRNSSRVREPQIRVSSRCCEHKWLSQAGQDLSKHHSPKVPMATCLRGTVSDPVPKKDEHRGYHDRHFWAPMMQGVNNQWGNNDEGEQEGCAQPIYIRGCHIVVLCGSRRIGREGEPLCCALAIGS